MTSSDLQERLERFVEHHVVHGDALPVETLCEGRPDLVAPLAALVATYLRLSDALEVTSAARPAAAGQGAATTGATLPSFDGFRTIERIGAGGMGEVYKLEDLALGRIVAGKVIRHDARVVTGLAEFLDEARALALFSDRRIVQVHEVRPTADPPVIVMEYVDGFELGRVGPSLEYAQRARILKEVCEAVQHAHDLGVVHRDLKPANIALDAELRPRILDFGLSTSDPAAGHFRGTPQYVAPEQLDASRPIDTRTDVYALGVILYELLCGAPPYSGATTAETLDAVRRGTPRLPVEIDPRTPEPLQAIALKAFERNPADRYQSAGEMARDLGRYLEGRTVAARPTLYASALSTRVRPHLDQIEEWRQLKLVYAHEADALRAVYRRLEAREDDWIVESRTLSYSQIALYLGAFLLMCGSLFYFGAHRVFEAVRGLARPFLVLAVPFVGLNLTAHYLYRREDRAVAVAFYLGGVSLLPLFLLILFHETGLWVAAPDTPGQIFPDGSVSNRQLQVTILAACVWSAFLALRTRTAALSTVCTTVGFLLALAVLGDLGLRGWVDAGLWDRLALHLMPLVALYAVAGQLAERRALPWFGPPLYVGAALLLVLALELLALDGRTFHYLGVSMQGWQPSRVSSPLLLDTLTALALNGIAFYAVAWAVDRRGSELKSRAAWLLFTISPFAVLEPLGWLSETGEYPRAFDWVYLALAVATALLSHQRQRKGFYYAGLLNTGIALWLIADHHEWFDKPLWAIVLVVVGLVALGAGFSLATRERRRARPGHDGPP